MAYRLDLSAGPDSIPAGTGILLLHPSTVETDRIDTHFLQSDTDNFLVVSTRTTASEVVQKLEFFDVNTAQAEIIDAISVERGYSRRQSDRVRYLTAPDDVDGLLEGVETFFQENEGKRRLSVDSITELAFYAGESRTRDAVSSMLTLLDAYDAVGLFHLATGVHDDAFVDAIRELFDLTIKLDEDGEITVTD